MREGEGAVGGRFCMGSLVPSLCVPEGAKNRNIAKKELEAENDNVKKSNEILSLFREKVLAARPAKTPNNSILVSRKCKTAVEMPGAKKQRKSTSVNPSSIRNELSGDSCQSSKRDGAVNPSSARPNDSKPPQDLARISVSTPDTKKHPTELTATRVSAVPEQLDSSAEPNSDGSSCYHADIESTGETESADRSNSIGSLSSVGSTAVALYEAVAKVDTQELRSEPSDSSVLANLHKAVDGLIDHDQYAAGVWRPSYIAEFLRNVIPGPADAVKRV